MLHVQFSNDGAQSPLVLHEGHGYTASRAWTCFHLLGAFSVRSYFRWSHRWHLVHSIQFSLLGTQRTPQMAQNHSPSSSFVAPDSASSACGPLGMSCMSVGSVIGSSSTVVSLCDVEGWIWDVDVCCCKSGLGTLGWWVSSRNTCFRWANFFLTFRSDVILSPSSLRHTHRYLANIGFKIRHVKSSGMVTFPSVNMVSMVQLSKTPNMSPWWWLSLAAVRLGISNLSNSLNIRKRWSLTIVNLYCRWEISVSVCGNCDSDPAMWRVL